MADKVPVYSWSYRTTRIGIRIATFVTSEPRPRGALAELIDARAGSAWHPIPSEMGMVVVSSTFAVGPIAETFDAQGQPISNVSRWCKRRSGARRTIPRGGAPPPGTNASGRPWPTRRRGHGRASRHSEAH